MANYLEITIHTSMETTLDQILVHPSTPLTGRSGARSNDVRLLVGALDHIMFAEMFETQLLALITCDLSPFLVGPRLSVPTVQTRPSSNALTPSNPELYAVSAEHLCPP